VAEDGSEPTPRHDARVVLGQQVASAAQDSRRGRACKGAGSRTPCDHPLWSFFEETQPAEFQEAWGGQGIEDWGVASRPRFTVPDHELVLFMDTKGEVKVFNEPAWFMRPVSCFTTPSRVGSWLDSTREQMHAHPPQRGLRALSPRTNRSASRTARKPRAASAQPRSRSRARRGCKGGRRSRLPK
jgi:hypothetical protein